MGLALLAGLGCQRLRWDNPTDAYASVARAVEKGELGVAFQALSEPTREQLAERAHTLSKASSGSILDDPAALFFSRLGPPPPLRAVTLAREEGDRAEVSVQDGRSTQLVPMVKEAGRWKLDLLAH